MQIEEYQTLAMRTSPEGHDRILNGCLGLIGESGDIVDLVKKWRFQSGDHAEIPKDKLIDECGDVLWYCAELSDGLGLQLAEVSRWFMERVQAPICDNGMIHRAVVLSQVCGRAYDEIVDDDDRAGVSSTIGWIIKGISHFLVCYCNSTLEEAMERNIDKLRRRYPDGFDPERSLHRKE